MLVVIIDKLINVKHKLYSVGKLKKILDELIAVYALTFGRLGDILLINRQNIKEKLEFFIFYFIYPSLFDIMKRIIKGGIS